MKLVGVLALVLVDMLLVLLVLLLVLVKKLEGSCSTYKGNLVSLSISSGCQQRIEGRRESFDHRERKSLYNR